MYSRPEHGGRVLGRLVAVLILTCLLLYSSHELQTSAYQSGLSLVLIQAVTTVLLFALFCLTYWKLSKGKRVREYHIRGSRLLSFNEAEKLAKSLPKEEGELQWGMLRLPKSVGTSHFAVVGATGSGKTVTLRLLMQSILPHIGKGRDTRAILYDAKQDLLPLLSSIAPEAKIHTLNPFDTRGVAWDMAKDVTSPSTCNQLAAALIPEDGRDSQPYFNQTARHLLSGILIAFNKKAKGNWTFRDVMIAIRDIDRIREILESVEETKNRLQHFRDQRAIDNVLSTFTTKMQDYEFIAASWDTATIKISLTDWIREEYILVLGNSETAKRAVDEINRVIFRRMTELLLGQEETTKRQTWVFIDEVRQAGKLDTLNAILTKGRSKGVCCVLGFQDIEGMRAVYGREITNELIGQCNNKAILKLNSPETAEWASKIFGDHEVFENRESRNNSRFSILKGSVSVAEQRVRRSSVMPGQFLELPEAGIENGISGYYTTSKIGSYFHLYSGQDMAMQLIPPSNHETAISYRAEGYQSLKPWDTSDLERLGLKQFVSKNQSREAEEVSYQKDQKRERRRLS